MATKRHWTKEEIDYLYEKWGHYNITSICKHLNRTENSVYNKASKLGLGRQIDSGNYITLRQLFLALGYSEVATIKVKSWIEKRKLPVKTKKLAHERAIRIIRIEDFWKWAEENKNFLDFSRFKRYMLGAEPDWVEEKRRNDIIKNSRYKKTKWTKKEDEYLTFLVNQFKYSYKEISEMTCRTTGAITHRVKVLNLKSRPIKAENHTKWTEDEKQRLEKMILKGIGYELMSNELNKSSRAIAGFVYRKYGSENLDNALKIINDREINN